MLDDVNNYAFHSMITNRADADSFKFLLVETDKQLHAEHVKTNSSAKFKLSWDRPGRDGRSPLMMAALCKNQGIFDLLLAYDADLITQDQKGNTALHCAVLSSNYEFAFKIMQNRNFDSHIFDIQNADSDTPVMIAVSRKLLTTVQHMVKCGANLRQVKTETRNSLLHLAAASNDQEMVEFLLT